MKRHQKHAIFIRSLIYGHHLDLEMVAVRYSKSTQQKGRFCPSSVEPVSSHGSRSPSHRVSQDAMMGGALWEGRAECNDSGIERFLGLNVS